MRCSHTSFQVFEGGFCLLCNNSIHCCIVDGWAVFCGASVSMMIKGLGSFEESRLVCEVAVDTGTSNV
jgi:hypothetical protein